MNRAWHIIAWGSLLAVLTGWMIVAGLGDRVWWTLPILFGPRWLWLLFVAGIVPCMVVTPRRGVPLAVAAALIAIVGIMDWRLGLGRFVRASGVQVWVMTLNAGAGSSIPQSPRILDEIRRVDADVVVITECGASLPAALQTMSATYTVRIAKETSNCLLVKGTITGWWERNPTDAFRRNGSGAIQRAEVLLPQGAVRLGLVHLATPRQALQEFRDLSEIPSLGELTRQNTARARRRIGARSGVDRPRCADAVDHRRGFQPPDRKRDLSAELEPVSQRILGSWLGPGVYQAHALVGNPHRSCAQQQRRAPAAELRGSRRRLGPPAADREAGVAIWAGRTRPLMRNEGRQHCWRPSCALYRSAEHKAPGNVRRKGVLRTADSAHQHHAVTGERLQRIGAAHRGSGHAGLVL